MRTAYAWTAAAFATCLAACDFGSSTDGAIPFVGYDGSLGGWDGGAVPADGAGPRSEGGDATTGADARGSDASGMLADATTDGAPPDAWVDAAIARDAGSDAAEIDGSAACEGGLNACGGGCAAVCMTTLLPSNSPRAVAVDGTFAYFTDVFTATLTKAPLDGGAPMVLATGQLFTGGLAIDGTRAYWPTGDGIMTVRLDGGPVTELVAAPGAGAGGPHDIAVDGTRVYWIDVHGVRAAALDGSSAPALLVPEPGATLASLAIDGAYLYFTAGGGGSGSVYRAPLSGVPEGGAPDILATGVELGTLAVDGARVYFTSYCNMLLAVPVGGLAEGGAPEVVGTSASGCTSAGTLSVVALDGANAYFSSGTGVVRVPLDGGAGAPLFSPFAPGNATLPLDVAVTGSTVVWSDPDQGRVFAAPTSGFDAGPPPLAFGVTQESTESFVVRDGTLYATTSGGWVVAAPTDGSSARRVATADAIPSGIALTDTLAVWTDESSSGAVLSAPLGAGAQAATTIAAGFDEPTSIVAGAAGIAWWAGAGQTVMALPTGATVPVTVASAQLSTDEIVPFGFGAIATDGARVYWASRSAGTFIAAAPLDGGPPATLVAGLSSDPQALALDNASIYWTQADGTVARAPLAGLPDGGSPDSIATGQNQPTFLTSDGVHLYWLNRGDSNTNGELVRAPLDGGPPEILAQGLYLPQTIAVDDTSVYFITHGPPAVPRGVADLTGGTVRKLTPK